MNWESHEKAMFTVCISTNTLSLLITLDNLSIEVSFWIGCCLIVLPWVVTVCRDGLGEDIGCVNPSFWLPLRELTQPRALLFTAQYSTFLYLIHLLCLIFRRRSPAVPHRDRRREARRALSRRLATQGTKKIKSKVSWYCWVNFRLMSAASGRPTWPAWTSTCRRRRCGRGSGPRRSAIPERTTGWTSRLVNLTDTKNKQSIA